MSKRDKASIYVDAQVLLKTLYYAQFDAAKRDRIALYNRLFDHCEKVISYFSLAYQTNDKVKYIELLFAEFEALKVECRFAMETNMMPKEGTQTIVRDILARMQDGIDKWHSFVVSARHD